MIPEVHVSNTWTTDGVLVWKVVEILSWNIEELSHWGHAFEVSIYLSLVPSLLSASYPLWVEETSYATWSCHQTAQGQAIKDRPLWNSRNNHVWLRLFLPSILPLQWDNYSISRQVQLRMHFLQLKYFLLEFTLEYIFFKVGSEKTCERQSFKGHLCSQGHYYNKARSSWASIKHIWMWDAIPVISGYANRQQCLDSPPHSK